MELVARPDRGARKLTDTDEAMVFARLAAGMKPVALATLYNVSHQTIYAAKSRVDARIAAMLAAGITSEDICRQFQVPLVEIDRAIARHSTRTDLASKPTCLTR